MIRRKFSLGQVLSVTTRVLLCDVGGLYEILNFMTRDDLYTHQLPRAARERRPWLLRQHPRLSNVVASEVNEGNWREWFREQEEDYGELLEVEAIPANDHAVKDPLEELEEMVPMDRIVVIEPEDEKERGGSRDGRSD